MNNKNDIRSTPLLHELFIEQAIKRPSAIAVKSPFKQLSYQELALLSKTFAEKLVKSNAKPNELIAIVMEKSWEQIVAVLSILMSGSAYLPIDPSESKDRLSYLLNISSANIILTQEKYLDKFDWPADKIVITLETFILDIHSQEGIRLLKKSNQNDLAYVIFTSGSTGTPKGVMITHRTAMNTILDINERFKINSKDNVFALSNLTFDLSVYDIFGTLSAGGTIVLPSAEQAKDPTKWQEIFFKEKISVWNSVPALMNIFSEYLTQKYKILPPHRLRLVLLSGDWIPLNLPDKIMSLFGKIELISLGGATETSIWSILYPIHAVDPTWKSIPYGKSMKKQSFHILDPLLSAVKGDEAGELFIGGEGVAAGYWRDPDRTDAQFIQHPLYGRLYKTGDLGRYLPDGNIEFLGRVDFQVKIAGYRIEINAIEKYLLDFSWIKQAIVLVKKQNLHQKLIAYIKFDDEKIKQKEKFTSLQRDHVKHWKKIYNTLSNAAEDTVNKNDPTFNTAGWINSYFKKPISSIQMQEWVKHTVKRILSLNPQSVLEIGCGTGLLLFRLAKQVKQYDATDLSKNAIRHIKKKLMRFGITNTKLIECEATNIQDIDGQYDTVILNSITQYFPSVDYLIESLKKCIDKIQGKGQIFIGDVRSLHLLNAFHTSLFINKLKDYSNYIEWKNNINHSLDEEDELLIDFNFFYKFKESHPRITHIEILLKEGKFQNEMNRFRYDVVLYLDHPITESGNQLVSINWKKSRNYCLNLELIHTVLLQDTPYVLAVKNIPNKRTAGITVLPSEDQFVGGQWANSYKTYLLNARNEAVDPAVIYDLAYHHNYHASVTWSTDDPEGCFDVLFIHHDIFVHQKEEYLHLFYQKDAKTIFQSWDNYANFPILPHINRDLILEVKKFLETRLPYYMVPSYFIPVQQFPMTSNGKIDRNLLPRFHNFSATSKVQVAPKTHVQKRLLAIWQRLLSIQDISIYDTFSDMGGTSLLSIELITAIEHEFNVALTYQEITACAINIKNMSKLIEKKVSKVFAHIS